MEKKKRSREIKKIFDKNKKKFLENNGEIDDMSYLDLDEEEEYDLICKFEDYFMKNIENQEKKKKESMQRHQEKQEIEKQTIKPKRSFARSNRSDQINSRSSVGYSDMRLNEINRSAFNEKEDIPELIYY